MAGTSAECLETPRQSGAGEGYQPGIIQRAKAPADGQPPECRGGVGRCGPGRWGTGRCGCLERPRPCPTITLGDKGGQENERTGADMLGCWLGADLRSGRMVSGILGAGSTSGGCWFWSPGAGPSRRSRPGWGWAARRSRNHVSNVLTKWQVADRAQTIVPARDAGLGHKSRIWGTSARSSFRPDRQYFPAHHDSRLMTPGHPPAETFIPTRAEVVRINATIRRVA